MSLPTIEELKRQCYIDGDHDNDLLLQFLSAAVSEVERVTNRKLTRKNLIKTTLIPCF
ncbi:head-tail connector protein [Morganella morganii]|uniref:head-tail connector protein n=1 Tax=Morganella morganii TaxID=582 RepID=UPI003D7FB57C